MKELILSLPREPRPKYLRLSSALRQAIRDGQLRPGEPLPSTRDMARRLRFDRHTVMAALAELIAEGWLESKARSCTRVAATLPSRFLQAARAPGSRPLRGASFREAELARSARISDFQPPGEFRFSFPSGFPDPRLFPLREFRSQVHDALKERSTLLYGNPAGERRLHEQISAYLRRARALTGRELVVTNGSQEALFLIAQLLLRPGDRVAVEELAYPPALEALRFSGARLLPVRLDPEGISLDHLERLLQRKKIRLLYLTPLHQYPTTSTLPAPGRIRLYELAYKYNFIILEDDYDHEFHYSSQPAAPLAAFDPAGIVIYVSTFSKILFPSARLGFLAAPARLAGELAKLKRISSRQNETILQRAIAGWMESDGFERHLRRVRRCYAERLRSFVGDLEALRSRHPGLSWTCPGGGMALWLETGCNSSQLAENARRQGILLSPEQAYRLDGKAGSHLRLGFTGQSPAENRAALMALSPLLLKGESGRR